MPNFTGYGGLFGAHRGIYAIPNSGSMNLIGHRRYAWGGVTSSATFTKSIHTIGKADCGMSYSEKDSIINQQIVINFKGNIIKVKYPNKITNSRLNTGDGCATSSSFVQYSCFPAGNFILAYDNKSKTLIWKPIEQAKKGDWIMGADGKPATLEDVEIRTLGNRDMLEMGDNTLIWSAEHSLWTQDKDGKEWLWSYDKNQWIKEAKMGIFDGLIDNDSIRTGTGYKFATTRGFKHKNIDIVTHKYKPQTKLFYPRTNNVLIIVGSKNYYGNIIGYVVSGAVNEHKYNYKSFKWDYTKIL